MWFDIRKASLANSLYCIFARAVHKSYIKIVIKHTTSRSTSLNDAYKYRSPNHFDKASFISFNCDRFASWSLPYPSIDVLLDIRHCLGIHGFIRLRWPSNTRLFSCFLDSNASRIDFIRINLLRWIHIMVLPYPSTDVLSDI